MTRHALPFFLFVLVSKALSTPVRYRVTYERSRFALHSDPKDTRRR